MQSQNMHAHTARRTFRCCTTSVVIVWSLVVRASPKLLRGSHLGGHQSYTAHIIGTRRILGLSVIES